MGEMECVHGASVLDYGWQYNVYRENCLPAVARQLLRWGSEVGGLGWGWGWVLGGLGIRDFAMIRGQCQTVGGMR